MVLRPEPHWAWLSNLEGKPGSHRDPIHIVVGDSSEDVSRNLLRAQSAASRVPPKILTYVQVCSGFRLPPLLAAWAPRDDFWTHLAVFFGMPSFLHNGMNLRTQTVDSKYWHPAWLKRGGDP